MASNSNSGIEINLDLIPQREEGMTPYEIMLSESQERMLLVAKKETVKEVQEIYAKWDLDAVIVGQVTSDQRLKVTFEGKTVVDIPVQAVVDMCPLYHRESKVPAYLESQTKLDPVPLPEDYNSTFEKLLSSPTIADKQWVFRQYDHMVQINTALLPGADASLLRLKNKKFALAMTLDGNSLYTYLDPKTGGKIAVAEACRNLACVGAHPVGVTNCLNFGNPEKPEIMWQFQEVIEGIAAACRTFSIPVTGGNVSFYNDTEGLSIHPTPVLGVVGLVHDVDKSCSPGFKNTGDVIFLIGKNKDEIGGSEYLKFIWEMEKGQPPQIDLWEEKQVHDVCIEAIEKGLLHSAHDISEGGLAVCIAECAFLGDNRAGCTLHLKDRIRSDALLFGESQSRIIVTVKPENKDALIKIAQDQNVPIEEIGTTGGKNITICHSEKKIIDLPVQKSYTTWKQTIPDHFKTR
jgi:phosphoribosylformylglycinamidine synthase